jgi:hypothetical protein
MRRKVIERLMFMFCYPTKMKFGRSWRGVNAFLSPRCQVAGKTRFIRDQAGCCATGENLKTGLLFLSLYAQPNQKDIANRKHQTKGGISTILI